MWVNPMRHTQFIVIPAKAGIQVVRYGWIPAFAGMTNILDSACDHVAS
ncbi:MAG: hypothetical protein JWN23_2810 [Rhodocyclales bacterium]|nr:hypothetical protein [Rhodocyclales bacterium]